MHLSCSQKYKKESLIPLRLPLFCTEACQLGSLKILNQWQEKKVKVLCIVLLTVHDAQETLRQHSHASALGIFVLHANKLGSASHIFRHANNISRSGILKIFYLAKSYLHTSQWPHKQTVCPFGSASQSVTMQGLWL